MVAALVEFGHDISGTTAQRPTNADRGCRYFDTSLNQWFFWNGFMWQAANDGPGNVRLFDHFLGDVIKDQWSAAQGSDGQGAIAAIVAGSAKGELILTAGDSNDINGISCLTSALNWALTNGPLVFEARVKVASIASVAYFIGFSDVLATTTKEETFSLSTITVTAAADDAFGFLFDTAATTDTIRLVGARATTLVTGNGTDTTLAPVADTYKVYRIEVTAAGVANFYIDGTLVGSLGTAALPVTTIATALTPSVYVNSRTTATKTLTLDYVDVNQSLQ